MRPAAGPGTTDNADNPNNADIAVTGLGPAGTALARALAANGYVTAVHDVDPERARALAAAIGPDDVAGDGAVVAATSIQGLLSCLRRPRIVLVTVPAGEATDDVLDALSILLDEGDIVADGTHARAEDTDRRDRALSQLGIEFVGLGISGAVTEPGDPARPPAGPGVVVGASPTAWEVLRPALEALAARVDGVACVAHAGPAAAGHHAEMVHDGIEYAAVQLLAEAYDLVRQALDLSPAQVADIFDAWTGGELDSVLVRTTATVLRHVDARTRRPFVDVVGDEGAQEDTAGATVALALDLGVPASGVAEAMFARSVSRDGSLRRAAARILTGPSGPVTDGVDTLVDGVEASLAASMAVAYAQGFAQLGAAATEHGWELDLAAVAKTWSSGVLRGRLLDRTHEAFSRNRRLESLLLDDGVAALVGGAQDGWRRVVAAAAAIGVPTPGCSSALAYYDGLRRERGSAAVVQGLRDLLDAQPYARTDRAGTFHTRWRGDGREVDA